MTEAIKHGAWDQFTADKYHASSPKLARFLAHYLDITQPVYDFGCGQGFYLAELASVGFDCLGVEGFALNNFLHDKIQIHDLSKPLLMSRPGTVLSFETGEHIIPEGEQTFLNTLTNNSSGIVVMSWATPGQPGIGHINCKSHEYIISQMEKRNFTLHEPNTELIRNNVDKNCDWLERNLLVFTKA